MQLDDHPTIPGRVVLRLYISYFKNKDLTSVNQWETTNDMAKPVTRVKRVTWVKSILAHGYVKEIPNIFKWIYFME